MFPQEPAHLQGIQEEVLETSRRGLSFHPSHGSATQHEGGGIETGSGGVWPCREGKK